MSFFSDLYNPTFSNPTFSNPTFSNPTFSNPGAKSPIKVAVVGATGVVGQRVLALAQLMPWIQVVELGASISKKGQLFSSACQWRDIAPMPDTLAGMTCCALEDISAPYVVSCLPSDVAEIYEPLWANKGQHVFSNASAFRMHADVPLLIPEINVSHLALTTGQKTPGKIITNPNCSATGIALAVAPILAHGPLAHVSIVTLQSISGAGYPGVASMDILGNTIPDIPGEAEKIVAELQKILGPVGKPLNLPITASVHRVPVLYGHVATLHITLDHGLSATDCHALYASWNTTVGYELFVLHSASDRPQARRDLSENDMRIHIGPIQSGANHGGTTHLGEAYSGITTLRINILSHNLVRGAAGAVLSNLQCFLQMQ